MSASPVRPLQWRRRTLGLLGVAGGLLALGVAFRSPVALYVALPLLLAPLAAVLGAPRGSAGASLTWGESGSADVVTVDGTVTPDPGISAADLVLELPRPAGLTERAPDVTEVEEGEIRFHRSWAARAPIIAPVEAPHLRWQDPAGLVERELPVVGDPLVVLRYPPELTRLRSIRLDRTTVLPGETRSRRLGAAGEFFGIRTATPGDPMRRINWRASARSGRWLANDFALERTGDLLLLLDARPSALGRGLDEELFAVARAAAAGIADSLLAAKARVGLGLYGEFLEVVPLATGRTQRARVRAALTRARISAEAGPTERCVLALRRGFPPGVTTFLISPLADEAELELVPYLRRRGYPTVVLSPSPVPWLTSGPRLAPEDERLVGRIVALLRRRDLERAWRDAPALDWEDFRSLGGFVEFLRRPAPRRFG